MPLGRLRSSRSRRSSILLLLAIRQLRIPINSTTTTTTTTCHLIGLRIHLLRLLIPAPHPQRNSHDGEVGRDQHGAGQIRTDADEAILVHEQVEEEALVQVLEQVIQAAERALHEPAQPHLVVPPAAHRLDRHRVDVVRDEAAVGARGVAQALAQHAAQHGPQAVLVRVAVPPHPLQRRALALPVRDVDHRVDQVQVGQLPVDAVVYDVHGLEAPAAALAVAVPVLRRPRRGLRVVERHGALQRPRLERQRRHAPRVVRVVVGVDPGLGAGAGVGGHHQDDVLGPQRPALEVAGESEGEGEPPAVQLVLVADAPGRHQHDSFLSIAARCRQDRVYVLARVCRAPRAVRVVLAADLEAHALEDGFETVVYPVVKMNYALATMFPSNASSFIYIRVSVPACAHCMAVGMDG